MSAPISPPILDIGPLLDDFDSQAAGDLIGRIRDACTHTGFFVVVGHRLDTEMAELFTMARRFFDQPQEFKESTPRVERYGFVPHSSTAIDTSRKSDNTEYLDMGLAGEVALPALDGLETAVRNYQQSALKAGAVLLRALAASLEIELDFFAQRMSDPQCRLRFLHYPPVEADEHGDLPVPTGAHTDYGLITMLGTDGVPGLEVKPLGGEWTPVEAPAGSLVINLGDMLARWTNDIYKSTPHRVVGPAEGDRISIPFFVNPNRDTIVDCIATCVTADNPCHYEPVTATEFLAQRIDSSAEPYVDPTEGPKRQVVKR